MRHFAGWVNDAQAKILHLPLPRPSAMHRSVVDNVIERLQVVTAIACHGPMTPAQLKDHAERIVDAVLTLAKPRQS